MKRPFALVLLCAAWVVAASAAPALGQRGNELPTDLWEEYPLEPTATPERQAASPQREMRVGDDGTDTPVLVALLIFSAGVGGLSILLASRLRRETPQAAGVPAPVQTAVAEPTSRPAPATRAAPAPSHAAPDAEKTKRAKGKTGAGSRVVRSRSSGAAGAPAPQPPRPPEPARAERETPARLEPSRPTEHPPHAHRAPPRGAVPIDPQAERDTCWIELHSGLTKSQFHAVRYEGGPALARSPAFRVKPRDDEPGLDAPAALRALVQKLAAAGWVQTGAGPAPWDLRFERERLPSPQAPRRTR